MEMEFRRLNLLDLESFVSNRLRALERNPSSFDITLEEEMQRGTGHFQETLSSAGPEKVIIGALVLSKVVGAVGVFQRARIKRRHTAEIVGLYVDEEYRNKGVGGKLLDIAIEHAALQMEVTVVHLTVESKNTAARSLYESRRFVCWGTEKIAMKYKGAFSDEDHMSLSLNQ